MLFGDSEAFVLLTVFSDTENKHRVSKRMHNEIKFLIVLKYLMQ